MQVAALEEQVASWDQTPRKRSVLVNARKVGAGDRLTAGPVAAEGCVEDYVVVLEVVVDVAP